jgi:hypothetical protein
LPKKSGKQVPLPVTVNKPRRNRADVRAGTDEQKDDEQVEERGTEIVLPGRHISTHTRTRDSESAYVNHRHNRYSCSPLFPHLNDPTRADRLSSFPQRSIMYCVDSQLWEHDFGSTNPIRRTHLLAWLE